MSALRVLVGCKRVIDYAVKVHKYTSNHSERWKYYNVHVFLTNSNIFEQIYCLLLNDQICKEKSSIRPWQDCHESEFYVVTDITLSSYIPVAKHSPNWPYTSINVNFRLLFPMTIKTKAPNPSHDLGCIQDSIVQIWYLFGFFCF